MANSSAYTLYLDESGTSAQSEVVCVAGFLAADEQWNHFARNWSETLREFEIPAFRAVEFAHSNKAFAKWKAHTTDTALRAERETFLRKLLAHVRLRVRRSYAVAVLMDEFREVDREYELHEVIAPRTFCARACIVRCLAWAKKQAVSKSSVRFVIEAGGEKGGELIEQVRQSEGVTLEVCGKSDAGSLPVQAADLFAFEYHMANRDMKRGQKDFSKLRFPLRVLDEIPKEKNDWGVLGGDHLRESVPQMLPKRVGSSRDVKQK